jgi:hypothetical protein
MTSRLYFTEGYQNKNEFIHSTPQGQPFANVQKLKKRIVNA